MLTKRLLVANNFLKILPRDASLYCLNRTRVGNFRPKNITQDDGIDGTNGYF
jgi:hypothetical protein